MSKEKTHGVMVTADDKTSSVITYHLLIDGDNMIDIYDSGRDVWLTFKNTRTNEHKKEYYHIEIDKKSKLWREFSKIIRQCDETK